MWHNGVPTNRYDGVRKRLGAGRAFTREILGKNILGSLTLGLGLLAPLFSEHRQGLQDKVAETIVVKATDYEAWLYQARERELERLMEDDRAHREGVNRLRREWEIIETDDEKRERIRTEERDEYEVRKRFARAMGLIETDDEERADRERRVREAHEFRERERLRRETVRGEREARERRVREDHERREREKVRRERYR